VLKEWQAGFAGIAVTLLMSALIVLDLTMWRFGAGGQGTLSPQTPLRGFSWR
jgi:hypothetical protein